MPTKTETDVRESIKEFLKYRTHYEFEQCEPMCEIYDGMDSVEYVHNYDIPVTIKTIEDLAVIIGKALGVVEE